MSARKATKFQEFQQIGSPTDIYGDFDSSFLPHPFTGQISRKTGVEAVKTALRNLILTDKYERLRNPVFGGNIRQYLFESFSPTTTGEIRSQIEAAITNFEPRIRLIDVEVTPNEDNNSMSIRIVFAVNLSQENQEVELTLYRVR